jgi:hypothetical protein
VRDKWTCSEKISRWNRIIDWNLAGGRFEVKALGN